VQFSDLSKIMFQYCANILFLM